ncbi:MAG TPA: DUF4129 domain-containing protein [Bacillales bacterium]|nr:DUF4129 domain-containing protein [Bacillales bacterium]
MRLDVGWMTFLLSAAIEFMMIYALTVVFYTGNVNPWFFVVPLGAMTVAACLLFYFINKVFKAYRLPVYFAGSAVLFVIGWGLGISLVLLFCVTMLLLWRIIAALSGRTLDHLWQIFSVTFGVSFLYDVVLKFFHVGFPDRVLFIVVFLIQTVLVISLHLLDGSRKDGKSGGVLSYLPVFGGVLGAAALFTFFAPYLYWVLVKVIQGLGYVIIVVIQFLFGWLKPLFVGSEEKLAEMVDNMGEKREPLKQPPAEPIDVSNWSLEWLGPLIVIVAAICVLFYVRRKMVFEVGDDQKNWNIRREPAEGVSRYDFAETGWSSRLIAPTNRVRFQLFQLQKKLRKYNEGRFEHETIGQWVERLPANIEQKAIIQSMYERVRYGDKSLTGEEWQEFRQAVKKVKENVRKLGTEGDD